MLEFLERRRLLSTDLQGSLSVAVAAYAPGDNVAATLKVINNGDTTVTTNFSLNLRLSPNTVYGDGDDIDVGSVTIPVTDDILPGGVSVGVSIQVPIPADLIAGAYHIVGNVDSTSAVSESNETNNTFVSSGAGTIDVLDPLGQLLVNGTELNEIVSVRAGAGAYRVGAEGEEPLPVRLLG